tara:strand:- start:10193 stop:10642 length:450 start_codon:yes stop_codon:yes gene_type:complete
MTVDEMVGRLDRFGQRATDLSDILTQIGSEITTQIRSRAPQDTGALKSSIGFSVTTNSLALQMLNYGVFQNYGVDGTEQSPARGVEKGIFGLPEGYKFKFTSKTIGGSLPFPVKRSIAERGLKPKSFFSIADLKDEVILRLEEELTQSF